MGRGEMFDNECNFENYLADFSSVSNVVIGKKVYLFYTASVTAGNQSKTIVQI